MSSLFFGDFGRGLPYDQNKFVQAVKDGGIPLEKETNILIKVLGPYVANLPYRYGLSKEEGIDAFTDAVVALITYIRLGKFKEEKKLSTLVYRLTKNKCIDRARRRRREKHEDISEFIHLSSEKNVLHEILIKESYRNLNEVLDRLRGKCKDLILKWGYWGYSMQEIADQLNMNSSGVARTQKLRCLKQLQKKLRK